ncbi:zinc finger B-box domain-containing protein 1 isoform X3 [Danio rerio]|uniref:Zinc finger B-box domain-containing protein 1 isoform X3 n=1 Tax=Danio rerio TaxID=7955 RepID=A0AB32TC43_DANRE
MKKLQVKMGASRWHSGQPGVLAPSFQNVRMNKENRLSPGKMKIRVLKDEPVPAAQKQVMAEPVAKAHGVNRKLKLKGKVCGQCEVQLAGLMCVECGEDYCAGCFVRFHQKGALKRHRLVPVQAELQTPVSTRDVLGRLQQQVHGVENQLAQGASPKSTDETDDAEERSATGSLQPMAENQIYRTQPEVLFMNDGVDVEEDEEEEEDGSLLRGSFDEEESARSFQEALKEWRERGQRPVSVMETQTEKRSQQLIHVEFNEDALSYMEKLLLKKHRRGQIEEFQPRSVIQCRSEPHSPLTTEMDELNQKLTAERMELHKYLTSLFTITPAEHDGKAGSPAKSCVSIVQLDEADADRSVGVSQKNESKVFVAVGNEDLSEGGEFGCSVSTTSISEMAKGSFFENVSDIKTSSFSEMWLPSQEPEQNLSLMPKSESFSPLLMSTTSEQFLSNSPTGGQKVNLNNFPKSSPRTSSTAQQDECSESLQKSSPLSLKTKLNQTFKDSEDHISMVSPSLDRIPFSRSSQCLSPAFHISKQTPKPPDFPSPRSRLVATPIKHSISKLSQSSPERAVNSQNSACPPLWPRESSQSGVISDRSTPSTSVHDSIRSTPVMKSSRTDEHDSPLTSKWLKGARKSRKTPLLSLQLNMSDSEEEMTDEDGCLVPSEEDSSDEELRRITDKDEQKNALPSPSPTTIAQAEPFFLSPNLLKSEPRLFTGSSQALHSLSQRQHIKPGQYKDLQGFFTLGLDPGVLQTSPKPAQTRRDQQNHMKSTLGQEFWRSSFQHHVEESLVTAVLNSQPISSTPRPFTPNHGRMSSQRLHLTGPMSRGSSLSLGDPRIETCRPYSSGRPLSRAAQEILEVQTVEKLHLQDSDEDEEDLLALACLEEEFRKMSTTPLDQGEVRHNPEAQIYLDRNHKN